MFVFPLPVSVLIPAHAYQKFFYLRTSDIQNICWASENFNVQGGIFVTIRDLTRLGRSSSRV